MYKLITYYIEKYVMKKYFVMYIYMLLEKHKNLERKSRVDGTVAKMIFLCIYFQKCYYKPFILKNITNLTIQTF